jgi:hypothetical protein
MTESNRSWTSRKLDWQKAINFDRRVSPLMFKIAVCIIQHASENARTLKLSDQTIADEIGVSDRNVYRARVALREVGWLNWRRTRNANIYIVEFGNVDRMLDLFAIAREQRNERRKTRDEPASRMRAHAHRQSSSMRTPAHSTIRTHARQTP